MDAGAANLRQLHDPYLDFEYEVVSLEILIPEDVEPMEEGDWDLTLFTCTIGGKTRITVRCARMSTDNFINN